MDLRDQTGDPQTSYSSEGKPSGWLHNHREMGCDCQRLGEAPRCAPTKRRVEPCEGGINAPLAMMDRLVLHELPREEVERERRTIPIDYCFGIDGFECGEEFSLLSSSAARSSSRVQRTDIVIVFSRPVHFSRCQRGIVHAAHTDHVPSLACKTARSLDRSDMEQVAG